MNSTRTVAQVVAMPAFVLALLGANGCPVEPEWHFTDVTLEAGFDYSHGYSTSFPEVALIAGGVAAGDVDGDGFVDLYVVGGTLGPNLLFRNRGDGSFEEVGAAAGVDVPASFGSGPFFADLDGDGHLDLLIGAVQRDAIYVFRNRGDGSFDDVTAASGITVGANTLSAAAADVDRDGDLDLFLSHWGLPVPAGPTGHLWSNDGSGSFRDASAESGISQTLPVPTPARPPSRQLDQTFTPNFSDVDGDGWPDLLVASDFQTSQIFLNQQDGSFEDVTPSVISDENGMGATIGDYDGDLDLDWFVSSIYDADIPAEANWGGSGNRLYRNEGEGRFSDVTDEAGVREGYWGWGSCFADFDNDGHLDLFHVNGFAPAEGFLRDPSRLFVSNGDGSFLERSAELGLIDTGQGRGVVCFDYDRDGDVDIFVANNSGPPSLFRNDGGNRHRHMAVRLRGPQGNTEGIGAKIYVNSLHLEARAGERRRLDLRKQLREIRAGSNFVSQDPAEAHFGIADARWVPRIEVHWPDGRVSERRWQRADRRIVIAHPSVR